MENESVALAVNRAQFSGAHPTDEDKLLLGKLLA